MRIPSAGWTLDRRPPCVVEVMPRSAPPDQSAVIDEADRWVGVVRAVHVELVPALFDGHPDHWWQGHSWNAWWAHLPRADRRDLLDLGWGEEADGRGYLTHTLRGATVRVEVHLAPDAQRLRPRRTIVRHELSDDFLVWLEEKRSLELGVSL